jgi:hemerythrin-like domain-containing protein
MKTTTLLFEDHKYLLRALKVLEDVAALVETGQKPVEKDVKELLAFLEGFGDRIHQAREEGILFPALLRDREQKNYREFCALIFEHDRQRSLIEGLQDSVLTKNDKDFVYYANRLVDILRQHIKEEEDTLFPLISTTLSPTDDDRIVVEMKAQDKAWADSNVPRLLRRLDLLESKYCVKTPVGLRGAVI